MLLASILVLMKILVSDMGGVLYSFDAGFDPEAHQRKFDKMMEKLGRGGSSTKEQLVGEWEAVNNGWLKVYPVKKGVESMLINLKSYKLVVVSTSLTKTSELILEKIGLAKKAWRIYDMSDFGSKKDPGAWRMIFKSLPRVDAIVEDGEKNLEAARQAAGELGFTAKAFSQVPIL